MVEIERPREILAKKIAYRGRTFQPRDLFDLACVAAVEPSEIAAIRPWLSPAHIRALAHRLDELAPGVVGQLERTLEPYPAFAPLITGCLEIGQRLVVAWMHDPASSPPTPN